MKKISQNIKILPFTFGGYWIETDKEIKDRRVKRVSVNDGCLCYSFKGYIECVPFDKAKDNHFYYRVSYKSWDDAILNKFNKSLIK